MSYNSIIKTIFAILISFLCFSCNQKELQNHNEAFFIDLVKDKIRENDVMVHSTLTCRYALTLKRLADELFPEVLRLQELREKALEQLLLSDFESADTILIKSYIDYLRSPMTPKYGEKKEIEAILKKVENIQYNHTEESKSKIIAWIYSCLELEGDILWVYSGRRPHSFMGPRCYFFSKKDTVQLGEKYEMAIYPTFSRRNAKYLHNDFIFLLDGKKIKIDYEFEALENVGLLYFTPPKKGSYTIKGTYILDTASIELDKATLEDRFRGNISQTFKVK